MIKDLFNGVKGRIETFQVSRGKWWPVSAQDNLVCYAGSDALAAAVAGKLTINGMYLVFENAGGAVNITADKTNVAATYASFYTDRSFARVSTMGEPAFQSSDTDYYASNQVVFSGVTAGTSFFPTVPITDGVSSFYHAALVAISDFNIQANDVVFSCVDLATPITKIAGAQFGVRWTLTFTTP